MISTISIATPPAERSEFSAAIASGWERRGLDRLLPFQRRVAEETGLSRGGNVMIVAPTSSGKTRLAEIAMARALESGRKAIYLAPTKALAEEKAGSFTQWLAPARYRVLCATRDRPESDPLAARGEFDVLVAVYEKMNHYLLAWPEILATAGALVIDEIQMLGEPRRGALLDLLLTKVLLSPYRVQLVALASEVAAPEALARWLGCELVIDRRRPRDLREGVLDASTGIFHYREVNTEEDGVESFAAPETLESLADQIGEGWLDSGQAADSSEAILLAAAASLALRGEPLIVFAPTRHTSRLWARQLAAAGLGAPPARIALPRLSGFERGRASELLSYCLERGVAFHNADLPAGVRELVEEAFNEGELRAIVSTATLGLGVNLAARNVLHYPWRVCTDEESGRPITVPLGRLRFSSQGGRAARLGLGRGEGRSMLVARSKEEVARLWIGFVSQKAEPIAPPLGGISAEAAILDLLAGGAKRSTENVVHALRRTFTAQISQAAADSTADAASAENGLKSCQARGLIMPDGASGFWRLTGLGETAAKQGIAPETVAEFRAAILKGLLREESGAPASPLQIYLLLALTDEGRLAGARLGGPSPLLARALGEALQRGAESLPGAEILRRIVGAEAGLSSREVRAYYVSRVLSDWVEGTATHEIEEKYNTFHGSLVKAGEEFAWLLGGLAAVAAALGCAEAEVTELRRLAERTPLGVPGRALPLARLRSPSLSRAAIATLLSAGLETPEAIGQADVEQLVELLGQDLATELQSASRNPELASDRNADVGSSLDLRGRSNGAARPITRERAAEPPPDENVAQPPPAVRLPGNANLPIGEVTPSLGISPRTSCQSGTHPPPTVRVTELSPPAAARPYLLEINLQSPGVILARGREVALPPLSFDLLAALAERADEVVTRDALYARLWPEGGPEEQQLDGHRRSLIRKLLPLLGADADKIAEVIRGIGFRLALPAASVLLRRS